jgi:hypothetical protein
MSAEHIYQLGIIQLAISKLPADQKTLAHKAAEAIREVVSNHGDWGLVALALVGSEIAASEED